VCGLPERWGGDNWHGVEVEHRQRRQEALPDLYRADLIIQVRNSHFHFLQIILDSITMSMTKSIVNKSNHNKGI
jgi:hypothetical protein